MTPRIISARVAIRVTSQSPRLDKTGDHRIVQTDGVHEHARNGKCPKRSPRQAHDGVVVLARSSNNGARWNRQYDAMILFARIVDRTRIHSLSSPQPVTQDNPHDRVIVASRVRARAGRCASRRDRFVQPYCRIISSAICFVSPGSCFTSPHSCIGSLRRRINSINRLLEWQARLPREQQTAGADKREAVSSAERHRLWEVRGSRRFRVMKVKLLLNW